MYIHIYVYAMFVQLSASEQQRFKEGIAINKSLSALANCVSCFWGGGFFGGSFFFFPQSLQRGHRNQQILISARQLCVFFFHLRGGFQHLLFVPYIYVILCVSPSPSLPLSLSLVFSFLSCFVLFFLSPPL